MIEGDGISRINFPSPSSLRSLLSRLQGEPLREGWPSPPSRRAAVGLCSRLRHPDHYWCARAGCSSGRNGSRGGPTLSKSALPCVCFIGALEGEAKLYPRPGPYTGPASGPPGALRCSARSAARSSPRLALPAASTEPSRPPLPSSLAASGQSPLLWTLHPFRSRPPSLSLRPSAVPRRAAPAGRPPRSRPAATSMALHDRATSRCVKEHPPAAAPLLSPVFSNAAGWGRRSRYG